MAKRTCVRCGRPMTDQATLCSTCSKALRATLARIANLWVNLEETIGKRTAMGAKSGNKPTKASEQPLPVDMHASRVADRARGVLAGWTRVLCEDNSLEPPADTMPAVIDWLHGHVHILRRHEAAVEACDEITWLSGDITRAVDIPEEKSRIFVGPCIATDEDGDPCPGEIHAIIPERNGGSPRMECRECGSQWDATQWTRLGVLIRRRAEQINLQKSYGKATS